MKDIVDFLKTHDMTSVLDAVEGIYIYVKDMGDLPLAEVRQYLIMMKERVGKDVVSMARHDTPELQKLGLMKIKVGEISKGISKKYAELLYEKAEASIKNNPREFNGYYDELCSLHQNELGTEFNIEQASAYIRSPTSRVTLGKTRMVAVSNDHSMTAWLSGDKSVLSYSDALKVNLSPLCVLSDDHAFYDDSVRMSETGIVVKATYNHKDAISSPVLADHAVTVVFKGYDKREFDNADLTDVLVTDEFCVFVKHGHALVAPLDESFFKNSTVTYIADIPIDHSCVSVVVVQKHHKLYVTTNKHLYIIDHMENAATTKVKLQTDDTWPKEYFEKVSPTYAHVTSNDMDVVIVPHGYGTMFKINATTGKIKHRPRFDIDIQYGGDKNIPVFHIDSHIVKYFDTRGSIIVEEKRGELYTYVTYDVL